MRSSDKHLEKALEEFNGKVNLLEENGDRKELLDAYINRGCVLSMLEMEVSAVEDFTDAIGIIRELEDSGNCVDPGYFVKAYLSRGELQPEGGKEMLDDYRMAASRLAFLEPGSKYYDEKSIVRTCTVFAEDLVDDYPVESIVFIDKGFQYVVGKEDDFSRNTYVVLANLAGRAYANEDDNEKSRRYFSEAIRVGKELYGSDRLADVSELVFAYVSKGDADGTFSGTDEYFADREAAIELMEDMKACGTLDDEELLSNLHGEIAQAYMSKGDIGNAEKHLLKQVSYNLGGSTEYLGGNMRLTL